MVKIVDGESALRHPSSAGRLSVLLPCPAGKSATLLWWACFQAALQFQEYLPKVGGRHLVESRLQPHARVGSDTAAAARENAPSPEAFAAAASRDALQTRLVSSFSRAVSYVLGGGQRLSSNVLVFGVVKTGHDGSQL